MTEKIARRGHHIYREYGMDPFERHEVADVTTREAIAIDAAMPLAEVRHAYFGADRKHRAYPVLRGVSRGPWALPHETCWLVATRLAMHGLERPPAIANEAAPRLVGLVARSDLVKPALRHFDEEHKRERFNGLRLPRAMRSRQRIARPG